MHKLKILVLIFLPLVLFSVFLFLYKKGALQKLLGAIFIIENQRPGKVVMQAETPSIANTSKSIFFVGDMMLDRGVEARMKKYGFTYPFEKIAPFLNNGDIVFGNLEGTIVKDPPHFPDGSLRFAFSPDVLEVLSFAGFNILSLANNHTDNMYADGLAQTRSFLKNTGIKAVGDPALCEEHSLEEEQDIVFLAFNKTFPFNCSDEKIAQIVEEADGLYSEQLLIVSFHWGAEYQNVSSSVQKKLAHLVIDSGADLIIGHHPHVVQEIEEYGGGMIFYSLGNFIFDQDFSLETQQGLIVKLEVVSDKLIYEIFPVQIDASQPRLMNDEEKDKFLENLSKRSDNKLEIEIKSGRIEKIYGDNR